MESFLLGMKSNMNICTKILQLAEDPEGLEELYRKEPQDFMASYKDALAENHGSLLLQAWCARLEFNPSRASALAFSDLVLMVFLCLVAGTLYKIPMWTDVTDSQFYPRYVALIPFSAMLVFTLHMKGWVWRRDVWVLGATAALAGYMLLIPLGENISYVLSFLFLPFLLWSIYGIARMGGEWRENAARIEYIRYFGELLIHASLFLAGGGVLLLLAAGLFDLLGLPSRWVFEYVALYGLAAIPLVAAWATDTYSAARRIVPLLAKIFSPLLLILIVAYMVAMAFNIDELFKSRATLLLYNVLLLCVLGTVVFTLTGRREYGEQKFTQVIVIFILVFTMLLDLVGVIAIVWRIYEYDYGFTANRLAVLGSNLVVLGNLATMCLGYFRHWRGAGSLDEVERGLAKYLPIYAFWTMFMVLGVPWLYRY